MLEINNTKTQNKRFNILFISSHYNYFIDHTSFNRMYYNLIFFQNHENFNVIVLQPDRKRKHENIKLKKNIKCCYFKEISILGNLFQIFTDFNPYFISKVIKILKMHHIDLIHVDFIFGINILKLITKIPISYNAHNVEYLFAIQIGKYHFKIPKFFRFFYSRYIYMLEKFAVKSVKNINAISYVDQKKFMKIYDVPEEKIIVSNMGYIKEIYNNPIIQKEARKRLKVDQNKFIVIYHGLCSNKSGKEALNIIIDYIAPQIKDKNILFLLAGKKMPSFDKKKNIKFLGFVKDIKEFLYAADVAIAPILRGSGIRIKILEYLSANIPLISTKKGAEGHLLKNGAHGYIVKHPIDDIVKKILELKNNPEKIKEFKINIKKLLEEKYNWDENSKVLGKKYIKILKRK